MTHFRMNRGTRLKKVMNFIITDLLYASIASIVSLHDAIFANVVLTRPLQLIATFCQRESLDSWDAVR